MPNLKFLALLMRLLTASIAVLTVAAGGGFYAGLVSEPVLKAIGAAFLICIAIKEGIIVIGDIMDDGQRNHSFMSEQEQQLEQEKAQRPKGSIITALAVLFVIGSMLVSCQSPLLQTGAQIGLAIAQRKGLITEGDKIIIGESIAIISSDDDSRVKEMKLSELGLLAAKNKGLLNPGDAILVQPPGVEPLVIKLEQPPQPAGPPENRLLPALPKE
ncbi:MAG: hypothetical protein V4662_17780 [Verrucomicrobiota bacterium]